MSLAFYVDNQVHSAAQRQTLRSRSKSTARYGTPVAHSPHSTLVNQGHGCGEHEAQGIEFLWVEVCMPPTRSDVRQEGSSASGGAKRGQEFSSIGDDTSSHNRSLP